MESEVGKGARSLTHDNQKRHIDDICLAMDISDCEHLTFESIKKAPFSGSNLPPFSMTSLNDEIWRLNDPSALFSPVTLLWSRSAGIIQLRDSRVPQGEGSRVGNVVR